MKNNFKLIAYVFISLAILSISIIKAYAVTEKELNNKKNEIEEQISNTNTEIAGIQESMNTTLNQINRLNVQIKECEDSLEDTSQKLDELNLELEAKKAELESAQADYNKQKKILDTRLIAIYESSKTTYLDILLSSKDLSDFLSKYYMLEQIAECDSYLLNSLDTYQTVVKTKESVVESKRDEVESTKTLLESKTDAMDVLLKDKNELIVNLSQEEIELNNQLEQFEVDKKEIEKQLEELARQNAIKASITPSKSGYISPLIGRTKANITTTYNGYRGHTGVDFAIKSGTEVVAVKSGTVVISDCLKNANGSYRSYGEYVVIDHHDGTMTLYAHGLPNSRTVKKDDEVLQGQTIMLSGSTGNSTGPHLHFEVRVNGKCVEPSQYLP